MGDTRGLRGARGRLTAATLAGVTMATMAIAPSLAQADGLVVRSVDLGTAAASLEARIRSERARDPALFALVAEVADSTGSNSALRSRSQSPAAVGVRFRRMGAEARWALADLAAFHGHAAMARGGASRRVTDVQALRALQIALLDSIGVAADPELAPVLRAAFDHAADLEVQAAAAVGLGHLGGAELPALLNHATPSDARFVAAVRGLGASHRPEALQALARLLDATAAGAKQEAAARELTGALAEAGSSWAWATGRFGTPVEGERLRRVATEVLVRNYARLAPGNTGDVESALRRVDHPEMRAIVNAARASASPSVAAQLTHLLK